MDRVRRVEQRRWDEEAMKLRHRDLRARAGFLQTKAEPRLYYKPWELRKEEEATIKRQREEVEERIRTEVTEFEKPEAPGQRDEHTESQNPDASRNGGMDIEDDASRRRDGDSHRKNGVPGESTRAGDVDVGDDPAVSESPGHPEHDGPAKEVEPEVERPLSKDDDHGGEELERGQEDDVIY